MKTLAQLLKTKNMGQDKDGNDIEYNPPFILKVQRELADGGVKFIIHSLEGGSDTLDFIADGNKLTPIKNYMGEFV